MKSKRLYKFKFPNSLTNWAKIWKYSRDLYQKTQFTIFFLKWEKLRSLLRTIFKNPKISLWTGKNLKPQPKKYTQKSQFWIHGWIGKFYAQISFTVENILLIYIKWRCSHFKYNDWDIPLIQVVTIYQWIEKNKFSIGKNGILSPLRILLIPQNFWPQKRPWIFKLTIWCFPPADNMLNENTSSTSLHLRVTSRWTES